MERHQLVLHSQRALRVARKPAVHQIRTQARRDAREKVTGAAKYAGDIIPPGALHARILRPPAHGATLKSVDTAEAEKYPGARVIRDGELVAVLHKRRDEAQRALVLVKSEWNPSPNTLDQTTIFAHLEKNAPAAETVADAVVRSYAAAGIACTPRVCRPAQRGALALPEDVDVA